MGCQRFWHVSQALLGAALLAALGGCAGGAGPTPGGAASSAAPPAGAAVNSSAAAPPALKPVRMAYSALWALNAVPWTAYDEGIFRQHGLDPTLQFISSAQTVPAALSGDVDVSYGGGYAVIGSRLGGSDLLMYFNLGNWAPYELMVTPDIRAAEDLRGKALGVSRFGSASDTATRDALRKLGLQPERDVTLLQLQGLTERISAMQTGQIAGGVALAPDNVILRRQGFHTLIDLGTTSDVELTNTVFSTARWLDANDATAQALVNALVEGIQFVKRERAITERVLGKYLETDDPEAIAAAYEGGVALHLQALPDLGVEAARRYLAEVSASDPRAVGAQPESFFTTRYMDRAPKP